MRFKNVSNYLNTEIKGKLKTGTEFVFKSKGELGNHSTSK